MSNQSDKNCTGTMLITAVLCILAGVVFGESQKSDSIQKAVINNLINMNCIQYNIKTGGIEKTLDKCKL